MKTNQLKTGPNLFVATLTIFAIIVLVSCTGGQREIPETPFTKEIGSRSHQISKERAIEMLRAYDRNADSLRNGVFRGDTLVLPVSETFNLRGIDSLLNQPGIAALRAYMSMDPVTRKLKLILVGVNSSGGDILQSSRAGGKMEFKGKDSLDILLDESHRIP